MAAFNKFNSFSREILSGNHDFSGGHTFKLMLSNGAPTASNAVKADVTEIATGNGYPVGGPGVGVALTLSSATAKVTIADEVITAAGGSIGPFRYGVIYNATVTSPLNPLVGWFDHGSAVTLSTGETFTADFDASAGAFTLA